MRRVSEALREKSFPDEKSFLMLLVKGCNWLLHGDWACLRPLCARAQGLAEC